MVWLPERWFEPLTLLLESAGVVGRCSATQALLEKALEALVIKASEPRK